MPVELLLLSTICLLAIYMHYLVVEVGNLLAAVGNYGWNTTLSSILIFLINLNYVQDFVYLRHIFLQHPEFYTIRLRATRIL